MENSLYEECLEHSLSWLELAKKYGYGSTDKLRSAFRREKRRRDGGVFSGSSEKESNSYEQGDDFINVICASKRMLTKEEVLSTFKVNLDEWEVESYKVKTSEGYRKDRKVDWHVQDGHVTSGDVEDTGKMLVVPMYHIEVRLKRKVDEIRGKSALEDFVEDAKKCAPVYPKIKYAKNNDELLYEVDLPDLHFGRLTWNEESGEDYDIKIAATMVENVITTLLGYAKEHNVGRILLPMGNDFFNVNSKMNTTVGGTPQQEDTRWQKTYRLGRVLAVKMVDMCSSVAPVDVVMIAGNHDEEKTFYLGDALECWYHNNPNVTVNNKAKSRKYYSFGKCLIGFAHGSDIKMEKLFGLMPYEEPELWAKSAFREWHVGHIHHAKNISIDVDENIGILIRSLRSLVPEDAWTFNSGLVGSQKAAESFLWDAKRGMIAQFTASPK